MQSVAFLGFSMFHEACLHLRFDEGKKQGCELIPAPGIGRKSDFDCWIGSDLLANCCDAEIHSRHSLLCVTAEHRNDSVDFLRWTRSGSRLVAFGKGEIAISRLQSDC